MNIIMKLLGLALKKNNTNSKNSNLKAKKNNIRAKKNKTVRIQSEDASSEIYGVYRGKVAISEARNDQEKKRLQEDYLKTLSELEAY